MTGEGVAMRAAFCSSFAIGIYMSDLFHTILSGLWEDKYLACLLERKYHLGSE